jgi:hypothetical protein
MTPPQPNNPTATNATATLLVRKIFKLAKTNPLMADVKKCSATAPTIM